MDSNKASRKGTINKVKVVTAVSRVDMNSNSKVVTGVSKAVMGVNKAVMGDNKAVMGDNKVDMISRAEGWA